MMLILEILWWLSAFIIFWAMLGYPLSLIILNKILKKENMQDYSYMPTVTVMVVAHNEESVIEKKLQNLLCIDYPSDKLKFLIASDFSSDKTDEIVENFIISHPEIDIHIHKSDRHLGKTNAQNETQELCNTEILVMTDANAMFEPNAVRELISYFTEPSIAYVSGQLRYINTEENKTANSEGFYWKIDLICRNIESKIQTITAGNGAIYAVRNKDYEKISPVECHDSSFPVIYALAKKRAVYNPNAIAYEKAAEIDGDEFKRKVRMNRIILHGICPDINIFNILRYHWFSYFYFGHRTCRYLLWLMHLSVFVFNVFLLFNVGLFWKYIFVFQIAFYSIACFGWNTKSGNRLVKIISYYTMTVIAQWKGVVRILTGATKPIWEKAESTR